MDKQSFSTREASFRHQNRAGLAASLLSIILAAILETKAPTAERPWKILGDPPQTLPRAAVDRQDVGMNGQSLPPEYTYRTLSLGYSQSPESPWCSQKWHPGASLPFWLVLPCILLRMTTRSHVTNKSSVDPWYQGGTEKQASSFPEPRLGQSSPLSRGYIPSRLSLFCTSTNSQEQGVPPRVSGTPTMYPSPAGRTQRQARQNFCPHRQVDE